MNLQSIRPLCLAAITLPVIAIGASPRATSLMTTARQTNAAWTRASNRELAAKESGD
jgi:hypothetical protein